MPPKASFSDSSERSASVIDVVELGASRIPLRAVRNPRARRYILRVCCDGSARVTIPRGGNTEAARSFAARHRIWIERQMQRLNNHRPDLIAWRVGSQILFRGELVRIQVWAGEGSHGIQFGTEQLRVREPDSDLRGPIEAHLRQLASKELPSRLMEYASVHRLSVQRVTVRNQRTRWGSCSRRRTISLNWRLIQTPPFVRDYICLHELMHLREMNHSHRFWREVEAACPYYRAAERWLKAHAGCLR